ncbi:MAG: hypothetical protein LHW64_11365, partial [Candidatus Cloacimonetes bacterium]|nr:hypothetical protein [Candidatus Cloacimonadota bacterium]MDY0230687.1 hypothetical protein [Candidatus Cloacimonadaceae bacterium]
EIETEQDAFYAQDRIYKNISLFMAIFVVLLAVMGIYAVSSVTVHAQMKDISIRKVCGAELPDLLKLYFRNYLYLYTGSGIIGLYLAYNLISIYADRFTLKTGSSRLGYPVAILLMALVVFVPLYINILKAYKADANRYLQTD